MPRAVNGGVSIHYEVAGTGPPVLLIPGLGMGAGIFADLAGRLAADHLVLSVEPRGSGRSDAPPGPYEGSAMADDMAAVLAHAGAEGPAHLVGQSMGGMIAQELAIRRPELVRSLVLLSTYAVADEWGTRVLRARRRVLDEMGFAAQVQLAVLFVFSPKALLRIGDVVRAIERGLAERPPDLQGYAAQMDYCLTHDAVDRLGVVRAPTLVLSGADDALTTRFAGMELAALVPGAEFRAVPEASHALLWEEPALVGEIVRDLIGRVERPAS